MNKKVWLMAYQAKLTKVTIGFIILLSFAILTSTNVLAQAPNGTNGVAWSPDGSKVATANRDGKVRIWNSVGQLLLTLSGHTDQVNDVAWSPNNSQLASGSRDRTVKVWNAANGQLIATLVGHQQSIIAVAWNPDGTQIASVDIDDNTTLRIWNTSTWHLQSTPRAGSIGHISWSPNGTRLALPAFSGPISISAKSQFYNDYALTLTGHTSSVLSTGWSPDGTRLVSGSVDHTVRVWDTTTGQNTFTLTGHTEEVWDAAYSPDGTQIASASLDGTLRVWNAATGQIVQVIQVNTPAYSLAWSPDSKNLAYGSTSNTPQIVPANPSTIVFQTTRDCNTRTHAMNNDGTNPLRRTTNTFVDTAPDG